ncbi:MAG: hypothetical protein ACR2G2_19850 [Pseudonocardia sp.]
MARPTRKMQLAGAAVVLAALVGGGVTYLATAPAAQSTASAAPSAAAPKAGHGKAAKTAHAGGPGMLGKVEHGEFTTASAAVMQVQHGAITAMDTGSLTVRSVDGYTASYTITPNTAVGPAGKKAAAPTAGAAPGDLSQLHTGDTVQVMATKTDGGATATRIAPVKT